MILIDQVILGHLGISLFFSCSFNALSSAASLLFLVDESNCSRVYGESKNNLNQLKLIKLIYY